MATDGVDRLVVAVNESPVANRQSPIESAGGDGVMRRKEPTMFLLAAIAAVLIALILFVVMHFSLSRQPPPSEENAADATFQVVLCYPDLKNDRLVREPMVFSGMSRRRVVEEIVRRLQSPERVGVDPALPPSARLQGVQWEGTMLVLDFDAGLTEPNFWQGSEVAHLRLQALVHSLASLPQVQRVKLTVNGQPPEPLGGHEEVSEPLTPDPSL
jgi:hypothetical protein